MAATKMLSMAHFVGRAVGEDGRLVPKQRRSASRKTFAASSFKRALEEAQEMIDTGEWEGFAARHVVALYDLMHEKCYGVAPAVTGAERHKMVLAAGGFVRRSFDGDFEAAVEYFRWLWDREIGREKWRKANGRETRRLTFMFSISGALLTDYRVANAREA